jgi:orotidine-5'-phosphate decarboxylase
MLNPKIIVALDYAEQQSALALLAHLSPQHCRVKVGKHMFTRFGPAWIETLHARGFEVFLDLKFHDIPTTVADACRAAADLGVWMVNVHALGGARMLAAARDALAHSRKPPKLIAVTVLTSLSAEDLNPLGFTVTLTELVARLARMSQQQGCDGVVCAGSDVVSIKKTTAADFLCVTPGIRLDKTANDQQRVMTPAQAIQQGADYLVIGRPITHSDDPQARLAMIHADVLSALGKV